MNIKLKQIIFTGFKNPEYTAKVIFSSEEVNIIHGNNGIGKTSFLKGLHSFLEQDEKYLISMNVKKILCEYTVDNIPHDVTVSFDEGKNSFNWKFFERSKLRNSKSLSIAIERGISSSSFSHIDILDIYNFFDTRHTNSNQLTHLSKPMKMQMAEDIYNFLASLNRKKSGTLFGLEQDFSQKHVYLENFETLNLESFIKDEYKKALYNEMKNISRLFFRAVEFAILIQNESGKSNEYPEKLSIEQLIDNKDKIIFILSNLNEDIKAKNIILDYLKSVKGKDTAKIVIDNSLIEPILRVINAEINNVNILSPRFEKFISKFNSFLIKDKQLIVNENEVAIRVSNGKHPLEQLSSGERHLLMLLFCTLFKCEDRDFLFIDEPEISLNTKWQTYLLPLLHELAPKTQIMVASHSPYIVNDRLDYLSELVVE